MARPKKDTIDYFPHSVVETQELFTIKQKFGAEGRSFWFGLLEALGRADGHYIKIKSIPDWAYIENNTAVSRETAEQIIELLIELEMIDRDLWESSNIIWCQEFVDSVVDVYKNRRRELPTKPQINFISTMKTPVSTMNTHKNPISTVETPVFTPESTQSKGKEIKENKIKVRGRKKEYDLFSLQLKKAIDDWFRYKEENFLASDEESKTKFINLIILYLKAGISEENMVLQIESDMEAGRTTVCFDEFHCNISPDRLEKVSE